MDTIKFAYSVLFHIMPYYHPLVLVLVVESLDIDYHIRYPILLSLTLQRQFHVSYSSREKQSSQSSKCRVVKTVIKSYLFNVAFMDLSPCFSTYDTSGGGSRKGDIVSHNG